LIDGIALEFLFECGADFEVERFCFYRGVRRNLLSPLQCFILGFSHDRISFETKISDYVLRLFSICG
jgi:hypothetical protein